MKEREREAVNKKKQRWEEGSWKTEDRQLRIEEKRDRDKEGEKMERKGQKEGVMEEQMNRDLITRPLCPESVG